MGPGNETQVIRLSLWSHLLAWPPFPFFFVTQFKRPESQTGMSVRGLKAAGECDDSALVKRPSVLLLDRSPRLLEVTAQAVENPVLTC